METTRPLDIEPEDVQRVSGRTLRELRESSGLSQLALAVRMGKKDSKQVSEWETGKVVPGAKNLALLLTVLETALEEYGKTYARVAREFREAREARAGSVAEFDGTASTSFVTDSPDHDGTDILQIHIREIELRVPLERITLLRRPEDRASKDQPAVARPRRTR